MRCSQILGALLLVLCLRLASRAEDPALIESTSTRFNFAHHLLMSGDKMRDQGDMANASILYGEAVKEYDLLIRENPDWDPAHSRFRADYCREQLRAAQMKIAQSPAPTNAVPAHAPAPTGAADASTTVSPALDSLRHQASTLLRDGQAEAARLVLLDALRADPDDGPSRLMIGVAQCTLGNYQDALYVLEPLAEEQPAMVAVPLALGAAYLGLGDPERALTIVRQAVRLDDASVDAHYNLARVLMVVSPTNSVEAQTHYHRAVELGLQPDGQLEAQFSLPPAPPVSL